MFALTCFLLNLQTGRLREHCVEVNSSDLPRTTVQGVTTPHVLCIQRLPLQPVSSGGGGDLPSLGFTKIYVGITGGFPFFFPESYTVQDLQLLFSDEGFGDSGQPCCLPGLSEGLWGKKNASHTSTNLRTDVRKHTYGQIYIHIHEHKGKYPSVRTNTLIHIHTFRYRHKKHIHTEKNTPTKTHARANTHICTHSQTNK